MVEMEIATLFAAAQALGYRATAAVVISDRSRAEGWEVDWSDTLAHHYRSRWVDRHVPGVAAGTIAPSLNSSATPPSVTSATPGLLGRGRRWRQ